MKKRTKNLIVVFSGAVIILGSAFAFSEPGSENDPLVTLSYVTKQIEEVKQYINVKVSNVSGGGSSELVVVDLEAGQYLIGGAGTELILRGGKSTAYGVAVNKGLSDVTDGKDIDNEVDDLPPNHLLIIPRDDERGAYAVTDSIFLVRGAYEIR